MKMLALVTDAFAGYGGIAQYNRDLLQALHATETISSIIILPRSSTAAQKLSATMQQLAGIRTSWRYVLKSLQVSFMHAPIHLIFCGHLYMLPLAVILGKILNVPVWLQIHGIDAWDKPNFFIRWSVQHCALITAVSRYTKKRFLSWAAIQPEKVKVLPNTIQGAFQPGDKPTYLQQRYGITDHKILLTVGRLSASEAYKGQDRVIKILPTLLTHHPQLIYMIAGSGDDETRLKTLAKDLGIEGVVYFLGKVQPAELIDHYRLADIYVMPSSKEGFGIVFLEAAACGLPVIAGNVDGSQDALLDGRLGYLIDPLHETALLQAILHALQHPFVNNAPITILSYANFALQVQSLTQLIILHQHEQRS